MVSSIKVEEMPSMEMDGEPLELPPGFRFHPTDEEIITHYLTKKVANNKFEARAIGEVDLNRCEPWDLSSRAKMGEKEWYFFCQRDRKYPTGMRTNRATGSGYWKATGKDKEIYKGRNCLVGMKKTLVFYKGRAPKGEKTNWVMHEYRLDGTSSHYNLPRDTKDSWVVCRVFHKSAGLKKAPFAEEPRVDSIRMGLQSEEDYFTSPSMPSLLDSPRYNPHSDEHSYLLDDGDGDFKAIPSSSSYPSYLQASMDMGNFQAFKGSILHHNPQPNLYNTQKSPISYPQSPLPHNYHSLDSSPNASVFHQERNHNVTFHENSILRGAAAVRSHFNLSTGGAPPENRFEHR